MYNDIGESSQRNSGHTNNTAMNTLTQPDSNNQMRSQPTLYTKSNPVEKVDNVIYHPHPLN